MDLVSAIFWLSLTLYHEGRNQEPLDQLAIAHAILNRVKDSGDSVKEVVLKPNQFSCFNKKVTLPKDMKAYTKAVEIAALAVRGHDFTRGALFYHEKSTKPVWRHKVSFVGRFGDHLFYKRIVKIKANRRKTLK